MIVLAYLTAAVIVWAVGGFFLGAAFMRGRRP